jgi:hypothetical protein
MSKLVSADDRNAILDLIARYYWAFDDGDIGGYESAWVGDGLLSGFGDPVKGMTALKGLVTATFDQSEGRWRHCFANPLLRYGSDTDMATAKGYCTVNRGGENIGLQAVVLATFNVARISADWKVSAVDLQFI